jgi:hypothetical protein
LLTYTSLSQTGSVAAMGMDGYTFHGSWRDLDICCGTAMIRKYDDETTITVTVGTIHKTATITDTAGYLQGTFVGECRLLCVEKH